MAGQRRILLVLVLTLTGLHGSFAEPKESPSLDGERPVPEARRPKRDSDGQDQRKDRKRGCEDGSDVPKKFRERFKKLPPESQERFRQNWSRWREMDPKEREKLMERGLQDREKVEDVIAKALRDSGLELTPDQREVFRLRYRQERRKLEEQLRDEVTKMRDERVKTMIERLQEEFAKSKKVES